MKKWLVLILVLMMISSLIGTVGLAKDNCPAAPAIAAELLREAGVEQLGPYVSAVARETKGRNATFLETYEKCDPGYRDAVRDFLSNSGVVFCPSRYSGMIIWLDASTIDLTESESVSESVSEWVDLSGKDNHAFAISGKEPTYIAEGLNYSPVVQFDGSQVLRIEHDESLELTSAVTIFQVVRHEDTQVRQTVVFQDGTSQPPVLMRVAGTQLSTYYGDPPTAVNSGIQPSSDTFYLSMTDYNGEQIRYFIDGYEKASASKTGNLKAVTNGVGIGAWQDYPGGSIQFHNGGIAEIIVYNRALNDTERKNVENYLINKYFPAAE